jgi:hypothetical protein
MVIFGKRTFLFVRCSKHTHAKAQRRKERTTLILLSLNCDQVSQSAKSSITNPTHNDQVLGAAERAELFPVLDDSFGQALTDAGQRFQFVCRSGVDIDECLIRSRG